MLNIFVLTSAFFLDLASTVDLPTELRLPPEGSPFKKYDLDCGIANLCELDINAPGCRSADDDREQDYMMGGENVQPFKYPWMVLFAYHPKDSQGQQGTKFMKCGGTLISVRNILSSRKCFTDSAVIKGLGRLAWDVRYPTSGEVYAWLGPYRRNASITTNNGELTLGGFRYEARREVIRIKIPPNTYGHHDLALVRIKDVQFTDFIRPICLPYDGIPLSKYYSFAGWGELFNNQSTDDPGFRTYPAVLQEMKNLEVSKEDLPNRTEPLRDTGNWPHNGSHVYISMYLNLTGERTPCTDDQGNGLVWHQTENQNDQTEKFYLIGLLDSVWNEDLLESGRHVCSPQNRQKWRVLKFTKVTYFMDYIYQEMNPDGFANNKCLPPACQNPNTTYITKDNLLSAPCGYVDGGHVGSFCIKGGNMATIASRRNLSPNLTTKSEFLSKGFAECVPCVDGVKNWNYQQWINEITLGSFSPERRERYKGVESPYRAFAETYFKGIFNDAD